MLPDWLPSNALTILAGGSLIGFLLGFLGGGGSLLAVPMLLGIGGITDPHLAIGTSAVAVTCNSLINSALHARKGNVRWRLVAVFSAAGILMAALGAQIGLGTPGPWLMLAFGGLTVAVGVWSALRHQPLSAPEHGCKTGFCPRVALAGAGVGGMAGFFGIGGGFLAVPALLWATRMPMPQVIGSALVSVGVLGTGTATTYALAGQVLWPVAAFLLAGGVVGGQLGSWAGEKLHARSNKALQYAFGAFVTLVGIYMIWQQVNLLG